MNFQNFTAEGEPLEKTVFVFPPNNQDDFNFENSYDAFCIKKASETSTIQAIPDFRILGQDELFCQTEHFYGSSFPKEFWYEEKMLEYLDNTQFEFLENSEKFLGQLPKFTRPEHKNASSSEEGRLFHFIMWRYL